MRKFAIISLLLCLVSSCRQAEESLSAEEQARQDSPALHVAVFPTMEALPLFYAERTGMLEGKPGIKLHHHESMTDCDTALVRGHVHASFTDYARTISIYSEDSIILIPLRTTQSTIGLYSPKKKEIKNVEQLKERLLGMERHSQSDYWSDQILSGTELTTLDLFRVQIGSTPLRYEMLGNGLIDAAFLPQPYSLLCDTNLVNHVWEPAEQQPWTILATTSTIEQDSTRMAQINAMISVYDKAQKILASKPDTAILHKIYIEEFRIPEQHLKRSHWYEWKPMPLDTLHNQALQEAQRWFKEERHRFIVNQDSEE